MKLNYLKRVNILREFYRLFLVLKPLSLAKKKEVANDPKSRFYFRW